MFRYGKTNGIMAVALAVLAVIPLIETAIFLPQMSDTVVIGFNAVAETARTGSRWHLALLPAIGDKLEFILQPLFGFTSSQGVSVPITALGAAGAAIGLVPQMVQDGLAGGNDIAVFTAMCMCWSGYLSTHVAMMDSLGYSNMTGKAIISHTIGGLVAGVAAHWIYILVSML